MYPNAINLTFSYHLCLKGNSNTLRLIWDLLNSKNLEGHDHILKKFVYLYSLYTEPK